MFVGKFEFFNIKDGFVWILIRKRNVINKILKKKRKKNTNRSYENEKIDFDTLLHS